MALFDLWDLPIRYFCNKVKSPPSETNRNIKKGLKNEFPNIFSEGLGKCTKTKVKIQVKENAILVFKPKRSVPYKAINAINQELDRLEQLGVISKV